MLTPKGLTTSISHLLKTSQADIPACLIYIFKPLCLPSILSDSPAAFLQPLTYRSHPQLRPETTEADVVWPWQAPLTNKMGAKCPSLLVLSRPGPWV